jgi:hypothetical protein
MFNKGKAWAVGLKSLGINNNQRVIVVNFHQDSMAIMHSNFFLGQTDRGLIYLSNHSRETQVSNQEKELGKFSAACNTNVQ